MTAAIDLHWLSDSLADPPPAPPVIVEGLLRRGELCVIGAPRGIGKTWAVLNLAALVGRGSGYLFGVLPVVRREKVLLCHSDETPPWMAARRWQSLLGETTDPPAVAESWERWRLRVVRQRIAVATTDDGAAITEERFVGQIDARLRTAIEDNGFGVVVIDPWAVFFTGSEDSNDEVEAALSPLRDLAADCNVAIVVVHHFRKANGARDVEDLWRGASRLPDAASTRVSLVPLNEDELETRGLPRFSLRRYADVRFLRREEPTEAFTACLGPDGWWEAVKSTPKSAVSTGRHHLSPEDVAMALARAGGCWPTIAQAAKSLGISREAANLVVESAKRAGLVMETKGERGRRFVLAELAEP